jgi:hypothetical protein
LTDGKPEHMLVAHLDAWPASAEEAPGELARHAAREAARLEQNRGLSSRSGRGAGTETGGRTIVSMIDRRPCARHGLFLVFALVLAGADGVPVHAEPRVVRIDLDLRLFGQGRRPTTRQLQSVVSILAVPQLFNLPSLLHQEEGVILPRSVREQLDAIVLLETRRRERRTRREAAIAGACSGAHSSAARLLVQAGLFDRRALRAAALDAAAAAARLAEMHESAARVADSPPPETQVELVASLLVTGRR